MPSVPWTVYRIRNNANGKVYIGITAADLTRRFKEHLRSARRNETTLLLWRAMRKHGPENFSIEPICTALTREAMMRLETEFIRAERANDPARGYNCTEGGVHPVHNAATKAKISIKRREFRYTDEQKAAMSAARKGRKWSPELTAAHKARMEAINKDPAHRAKISAATKGRKKRPQTDEQREVKRQQMRRHFAAQDPACHGSVLREQKEARGRTYTYWTARVRYHGVTHRVFCKTEADAEKERRRLSLELYGADHRLTS